MKTRIALTLVLLLSTLALAQYQPPEPLNAPDYFGAPNFANSPLPAGSIAQITILDGGSGYTNPTVTVDDPSGSGFAADVNVTDGVITSITVTNGGTGYIMPMVRIVDANGVNAAATASLGDSLTGGIHKFVDQLPGICGVTPPTPTLGICIPLAQRLGDTYGQDSDFYRIAVVDYQQQMHTDLSATQLRGYVQLDAIGSPLYNPPTYLGPIFLAAKNRPVRIKLTNGSMGDLFLPVDTTAPGAGQAADGSWFTQNRATLHLQGANNPWISNGGPHQWITPAGETGGPSKGAAFQNVPDMIGLGEHLVPDEPTDGDATFYFPNQQSGRFLFFRDNSYGLSRVNTYAGQVGAYLLVDPVQELALQAGTAPGTIHGTTPIGAIDTGVADVEHLIPVIIQDKTFVPPAPQLNAQDPTWNAALFGAEGNLWFPHVYMPNQNPNDESGINPLGRWDYGPWFWPPQGYLTGAGGALSVPCAADPSQQCPITPNPSITPDAFMDTPVINGTAYPVLHVAPAAYRFQMLNASNDRSWSLGLYRADDLAPTEVAMLPASQAASGLPACSTVTRISNPASGVGVALASLDGSGNPINNTGLPSACWPTTWPNDGRTGGVPDPTRAGPPLIQIGSESGLLPAPVVIPSTPTNYEYEPGPTALNVSTHGLWLGPGERADVIINFGAFSGQTLILYNDAPAPAPTYDSRYDYYTNNPDQIEIGGAPSTRPGYGPNTRTIMQVVVDATNPNEVPFNLGTLTNAIQTTGGVYADSQAAPLVPQASYNSPYGASYTNQYVRNQDSFIPTIQGGVLAGIAVINGGSGYTAPTVTVVGGGGNGALATATVEGGVIAAINVTNGGSGYTSVPTIAISDATGSGAAAVAGLPLLNKTIQQRFSQDYGRMVGSLGTAIEAPYPVTAAALPLGYVDPPTEVLKPGEVQAWRISNTGVDTQFIHFDLFDAQVVNRVTHDGGIRPPDPNEIGWKDTVRMNPGEDVVIAVRPTTPSLPFPVRDSNRMMDVTMGEGFSPNFTGIDPFTGDVLPIFNQQVNFGWEYAWDNQILGQEGMRPMVYYAAPETPTDLLVVGVPADGLNVTWMDRSVSETGFIIERAHDAAFTDRLVSFQVPPSEPSTAYNVPLEFRDRTIGAGYTYWYRIRAFKDVFSGYGPSGPVTARAASSWHELGPVGTGPTAWVFPTVLNFAAIPIGTPSASQQVTIRNIDTVQTLTIANISISGVHAGDFAQTNDCPATLAPGESCVATVTYTPTGTRARYGYLVVNTDDPARPEKLASLRSPGYVPTASLAPATLDFGGIEVNTTSNTHTLTLSSTNPWPVQITSITVNGASAPLFAITNDCGDHVGAMASCTISLTFAPTAAGARGASVVARTNAGNFSASLTGTGVRPAAGISTNTVAFGPVQVNTTSAPQPVVLTNTGTVPLGVNSVALAGASASWFGQTHDCGESVAVGASCTISVTFRPLNPLTRYASLVVSTSGGSFSASLSGTGVKPAASVNRSSIGFGSVQVGSTSVSEPVVLTNTGSGPLDISGISVAGASAAFFAQTNACGASLPVGGSCTINVTFTPTAAVTRTASVSIRTAAGNFSVTLGGTGVAPSAILQPTPLAFGDVPVGSTSESMTATLTNTGIGQLTISSGNIVGSGAASFGLSTTCGGTLAVGASCTYTVTFSPTAAGSRAATLSVVTNAGTRAVALSGRGN